MGASCAGSFTLESAQSLFLASGDVFRTFEIALITKVYDAFYTLSGV